MTRQNPDRRRSDYQEIQERKKRQLERERQRETQRRRRSMETASKLTESQRERLEYRERQKRRASQAEKRSRAVAGTEPRRTRPQDDVNAQTRKSAQTRKPSQERRKTQGKKGNGKRMRNSRRKKSVVGMILLVIQILASVLFMFSLVLLNILPMMYLAVITAVLSVFALIVWLTQRRPKGKGIIGKIFSILITLILCIASFYIIKTNGLLNDVFGSSKTTNKMVVAVLKDDPAESIQDTTNYVFGVQYANGGDNVEAAVTDIEKQVDSAIEMTEYKSVQEQAQALVDGEVDAIIYSAGYTSLMKEAVSGYSDKVRIIYENELKVNLGNTSGSVEKITEPFSVYISGIDVYGEVSQTSRSDVNIIATVNPKTHQILLTTTPRDFYVTIPDVSHGEYDKLTHAGIYGVEASMATLENLYDTEIDMYARLNFTSLINIVDELGGVEVYSEYAFTTSEDSEYVMDVQKGYNTFNGEQALAFARERQNVPGGDNQRGKDQQAVITAMIKKLLSPTMLIKASGLIDSLSGNVETSMSLDQMHSLIKSQLRSNAKWSITSVEPLGEGANRTCYSSGATPLYVTIPDETSVAEIAAQIDAVENGQSLEGAEQLN